MSGIYQVYTMIINFLGFPDETRFQSFESALSSIMIFDFQVSSAWQRHRVTCVKEIQTRALNSVSGNREPTVTDSDHWQLGRTRRTVGRQK